MSIYRGRITSKGQLVIPKHLRDRQLLRIGELVRIESQEGAVRIASRAGWVQATAGCLTSSRPPLEPEELDELAERPALQEANDEWGAID